MHGCCVSKGRETRQTMTRVRSSLLSPFLCVYKIRHHKHARAHRVHFMYTPLRCLSTRSVARARNLSLSSTRRSPPESHTRPHTTETRPPIINLNTSQQNTQQNKPLIRFRNPWTTMTHAAIHASTSKAHERRALRCVGRAREEGRVTRCSRTHERYVTHTCAHSTVLTSKSACTPTQRHPAYPAQESRTPHDTHANKGDEKREQQDAERRGGGIEVRREMRSSTRGTSPAWAYPHITTHTFTFPKVYTGHPYARRLQRLCRRSHNDKT
jgi:hypothetical protein